jgi:polyisoprenoid-binding protein YceI
LRIRSNYAGAIPYLCRTRSSGASRREENHLRTIVIPIIASLALFAPVYATTYTLDLAHIYPQFEIRHLLFFTLHGQFRHVEGTVTMDRKNALGSVEAIIDVKSLDTGFATRDEVLLAAPFFDAAKYPTITYKSTKVTYQGKDRATVQGDFTLHGVTRPLTLHVTRISCSMNPLMKKNVCRFDAWADIKRSDFGMTTYLPVIQDKVKLVINSDAIETTVAP